MAQKYFFSLLMTITFFLYSCGKGSSNEGAGIIATPPITGNSSFLNKVQETSYFCDEAECPKYFVAVAVNNLGDAHPTWCTGTVIKNGQVLTSKTCFGEFFLKAIALALIMF